jgi:hypothetical protein
MADIKELSQEAQYSVQRTIVQRNSVQGVLCTPRRTYSLASGPYTIWSVLSPQFY